MTSHRKLAAVAASATLGNVGVAITVNLLTSNWSWLIFLVLARLSGTWVGLEFWRALPARKTGVPLAPPTVRDSFVPRPELADPIVRTLLTGRKNTIGITTALTGAGVFGKTTLAEDVCSRA